MNGPHYLVACIGLLVIGCGWFNTGATDPGFPVKVCYAMTINKAQGQSLKLAGVDLRSDCFSHGQLYVACSRVSSADNLIILQPEGTTKNVVYREFLDFDNLPETNFSCEGKVIGGYYADTETGCQMFHVCTIGQKGEITDIKFLCLNGTVFDQETRVCERLDEVDCSKSESYYDLNLELYGNNGAGYGIQPENEEIEDPVLCQEEDEEDCETQKPSSSVKLTPTEQVQGSNEESEEEQTTYQQQPATSSTTTRRPVVTSTSFPSTTPTPQILQFPTSSPESIAALLALHKAFTQSLRQHSNNKDAKINPTKITGFIEKHNPITSTQDAEIFEIKPGLTSSQKITSFTSKNPTPNNIQNSNFNPIKTQYQSSPRPQYHQNPPNPQYQNPQDPKQQYQSFPKTQSTGRLPPTFSKQTHSSSQRFGNLPFHHSFHISSQFSDPNYHDSYSDHDSQPSSQPQNEPLKQYDFNDYEDDYYDEKPHSSTVTPYLLHQLKVNQVQSNNKANVASTDHGSFVREVANPNSQQNFNAPSFRSITTPGLAIIKATSTTSSSSIKTSKLPSAIQSTVKDKIVPTVFLDQHSNNPIENGTIQLPDPPQSYDDYREGDVRSDPFYKDVPKIGRNKRSLTNDSNIKNKLSNSVVINNSEAVIHSLLEHYCKYKLNSSDIIESICGYLHSSSKVSDENIGGRWDIVFPTQDQDYLYLIKTITSSNKYNNITQNILLLLYIPERIKTIKDNNFKKLTEFKNIVINQDAIKINSFPKTLKYKTSHLNFYMSHTRNISLDEVLVLSRAQNNKSHSEIINPLIKGVPPKYAYKILGRRKRQSIPSTDFNTNLRVINRNVGPNMQATSRRSVQQPRSDSNNTTIRDERQRIRVRKRRPVQRVQANTSPTTQIPDQLESYKRMKDPLPTFSSQEPRRPLRDPDAVIPENKNLGQPPTSRRRGQGRKYHFSEGPQTEANSEAARNSDLEVSTTYPFNLKPGTKFTCDDKIKGGYYADVESECYGYFICSQGEVNGPLLKSHFWCGPTTKFNQRSRTCQVEANVACAVSTRYFYLNKDILSLPDPVEEIKDSFEVSKIPS